MLIAEVHATEAVAGGMIEAEGVDGFAPPTNDFEDTLAEGVTVGVVELVVEGEGVTDGEGEVTPDRTNSRNNMVAGIALPGNICK